MERPDYEYYAEGIEAAESAIHYVAPVGEKQSYVNTAIGNIKPNR